jgi:fructokinase
MMGTGRFGLIEAGGTKFVLGVSDAAGTITVCHRVPTTTPAETLAACVAWFRVQAPAYEAIGIAAFGPLDLDHTSPNFGRVRETPKPHWSGADFIAPFAEAFSCPVALDTDVNGAALAEAHRGAGRGHNSLLYLTIGTGVGGGFVSQGHLLAGLSHPEMGHIRLPRHPQDGGFAGACPFHGDCLEGLAAGPAVIARWGASLSDLAPDHPGHGIIAWYLGRALATFQAVMDPARIVLGGGVMATPGLIERVRAETAAAGAGYFVGKAEEVVVAPALATNSGLLGALELALRELAVK